MIITQDWLDNYIDKGMHYCIKVLNNKGYRTQYCCEGHWKESFGYYTCGYIMFADSIPKELFPKLPTCPWKEDGKPQSKYKTPIMEMGTGYKNIISEKESEYVFYWRGTKYKRMSREDKDKEHEQILKELNEWADSLPPKK